MPPSFPKLTMKLYTSSIVSIHVTHESGLGFAYTDTDRVGSGRVVGSEGKDTTYSLC